MGKGMSVVASQAVQLEKTLASGDHETASTKALFFGQPKPLRRSGVLRSAQTCGFAGRWTGVQQAEARQLCISSLHRAADNDPVSTLATESASTCTAEHDASARCDPGAVGKPAAVAQCRCLIGLTHDGND